MAQSLAERFRKARFAFEAGQKMGCSPRDAAARLRWEETDRRLRARKAQMDSSRLQPVSQDAEKPTPWFKRGGMA